MRKTKYTVKYTTAFKKDYKRAIKRGLKIELLEQVVALLSMGEPLPDKNRDHDLSGDWVGHRECHILPDWLLIYRIEDDVLVLTLARTGSLNICWMYILSGMVKENRIMNCCMESLDRVKRIIHILSDVEDVNGLILVLQKTNWSIFTICLTMRFMRLVPGKT